MLFQHQTDEKPRHREDEELACGHTGWLEPRRSLWGAWPACSNAQQTTLGLGLRAEAAWSTPETHPLIQKLLSEGTWPALRSPSGWGGRRQGQLLRARAALHPHRDLGQGQAPPSHTRHALAALSGSRTHPASPSSSPPTPTWALATSRLGPPSPHACSPARPCPTLAQLNQLLHAVPVHGAEHGQAAPSPSHREERKGGRKEGRGGRPREGSPPSSGSPGSSSQPPLSQRGAALKPAGQRVRLAWVVQWASMPGPESSEPAGRTLGAPVSPTVLSCPAHGPSPLHSSRPGLPTLNPSAPKAGPSLPLPSWA